MIYLTPERRLCFLFDQASSLQDSELSEEVLLEEVLCKSLFPHQQHGQPAGQPPLHSHFIASSPALWAYKPECYGACQLSGAVQARTFARKNVRPAYLYLPIPTYTTYTYLYLSIPIYTYLYLPIPIYTYLSDYLSVCLSTYLTY